MKRAVIVSHAEATQLVAELEAMLETDAVHLALTHAGLLPVVFGNLALLSEYLMHSKAVPLRREQTRAEIYERQLHQPHHPQAGVNAA